MVALGTALSLVDLPGAARMADMEPVTLDTLAERARVRGDAGDRTASLPPLFDNEADYDLFRERHSRDAAPRKPLESASGPLFLGVDLGSTTVKAVLADADGAVLTSWYERNQGDPLAGLLPYLADLIDSLPEGAWIQSSVATGYGAQLAQAALGSLSARRGNGGPPESRLPPCARCDVRHRHRRSGHEMPQGAGRPHRGRDPQ